MRRFILAAAALALFVGAAYAQTTVPGPTTVVAVPVGDWVNQIVPLVGEILVAVISGSIMWALRHLPDAIRANISAAQVKQAQDLLVHAADYGLNTIAADVKGKTVSVDLGNAVAAAGVQYVVDHGPADVVNLMGGEEAIKQKIIARLPISEAATPSSAPAPATVVVTPVSS